MTSSYLFYQVHSGYYIENSLEGGKGRSTEACERANGNLEQGGNSGGSEKGLNFMKSTGYFIVIHRYQVTEEFKIAKIVITDHLQSQHSLYG